MEGPPVTGRFWCAMIRLFFHHLFVCLSPSPHRSGHVKGSSPWCGHKKDTALEEIDGTCRNCVRSVDHTAASPCPHEVSRQSVGNLPPDGTNDKGMLAASIAKNTRFAT